MHMSEMDGFGLVTRIRSLSEMTSMPVLMLSSGARHENADRCRQLGIGSFLSKPVRRKELLAAIVALLRRQTTPQGSTEVVAREFTSRSREVRILLAEDNRVNQAVASRLLTKLGYTLIIANNGQEAIDLLKQQTFDLVLMDVQMPEMDGISATKRIREYEKSTHGHVPIIAMTAHVMKEDRARCLAAGMDGYVTKPISSEEVEAAILTALDETPETDKATSLVQGKGKMREAREVRWNISKTLEQVGGDEALLQEVLDIFLERGSETFGILASRSGTRNSENGRDECAHPEGRDWLHGPSRDIANGRRD